MYAITEPPFKVTAVHLPKIVIPAGNVFDESIAFVFPAAAASTAIIRIA